MCPKGEREGFNHNSNRDVWKIEAYKKNWFKSFVSSVYDEIITFNVSSFIIRPLQTSNFKIIHLNLLGFNICTTYHFTS